MGSADRVVGVLSSSLVGGGHRPATAHAATFVPRNAEWIRAAMQRAGSQASDRRSADLQLD
ncbi:MAG: hypothetical protein AB7S26_19620 [Sandaracinaceae bacterium]